GYNAARLYGSLQAALGVYATMRFSRDGLRLDDRAVAGLGALTLVWCPNIVGAVIWYDADVTLITLLTGLVLYRAWSDRSTPLWAFAGGVGCAISFWFKQDVGAGALFGGAVAACIIGAEERDSRRPIAFIAGAALVFIAVIGLFAWTRTLGDYWSRGVLRAINFKWVEGPQDHVTLRKLISPFTTRIDRSSKGIVLLYSLAPVLAYRAYRAGDRAALAAAGASFMWLAAFYSGLMTHGRQAYTTKVATLTAVLAVSWRYLPASFGVAARRALLAFALLLAWYPVSRWGKMTVGKTVPVTSDKLQGLRVMEYDADLDALIAYIKAKIPASDELLLFYPMVAYFATGRAAPTPAIDLRETLPADEDKILGALVARKPRWYIRRGGLEEHRADDFGGMPRLKEWIVGRYQYHDRVGGDRFSVE
ncbi:MAG: hypothetical protein HYZ74_00460, partial [Elusimicrobia bacterium]|nr:hypothetical protein [Elusimicrobiota bacterium]